MVFDPPVMKIKKGDTIHFKSVDMAHNSESISNMMPEGGDTWMGAMSEDISVTFNTEGVYVYRHKWSKDMLLMWDNRTVVHAADGGYDGYERLMHRITVN